MNHLKKAIVWLLLALLMVVCCVMDVMIQNWLMLVGCIIIYVFDIIYAYNEFAAWAKEQGCKKDRER